MKRLKTKLGELETVNPVDLTTMARVQGEVAALRWLFSDSMSTTIDEELRKRNDE
jgi:hypothetical protein